MALQSIGRLFWPDPTPLSAFGTISSNAAYQINGSGYRIGFALQLPKSGTITKLGVRINTCASAVTSRLGLYTLDGSNQPTSTGYGSSTYGTFTPAASTYSEVTLGTPATATAGDWCAFIVEFDSTAGDMFLSGSSGSAPTYAHPSLRKYSGTWSNSTSPGALGHIYYNDGSYAACGLTPFTGIPTTATYNSGSSPNEYALKFVPPFKCRVIGIGHGFNYTTNANYDAILYDSGTTSLGSASVTWYRHATGNLQYRAVLFATPITLTAGSTYRAAIKATTNVNLTANYYPLYAAGAETALGVPSGTCMSTRAGGSWTDDTVSFPHIWLILDQLDDGASTGGMLWRPGMSGGING